VENEENQRQVPNSHLLFSYEKQNEKGDLAADRFTSRLQARSSMRKCLLTKVAEANFPSRFGHFRIYGFLGTYGDELEECVALTIGDLSWAGDPPLVRIHSQCLTGDVFHSLACDCRSHLELSLNMIAEGGGGLLIYEHQEGRGTGRLNKLRVYELQGEGADTVQANERLGFETDLRDYQMPADIIRYFQVKTVRLLSNNPDNIAALERAGIQVAERIPCIVAPHESSEGYLRTNKHKLGHLLD
jgi:GTP cyclohydrolase II